MALLGQFTDGNPLTAAQLNAMVDKLNLMEPIFDTPIPLFQRREFSDETQGLDGNNKTWAYLILHKTYNTKLYYKYEIEEHDDADNPEILLYVADITAPYDLPTPNGHTWTEGSINLADRITGSPAGVAIPGGAAYVVRFKIERDTAKLVRLHWLYEGI